MIFTMKHRISDEERSAAMKRIEAIIRPTKVGKVCVALETMGQPGPRISQIEDISQKDTGYLLRGATYKANLVTKSKVEVIAKDAETDKIIRAIREAAFTGESGDGEIFVYAMDEAIRIMAGDGGEAAVQ
jgi:nitrogen regulatory protein PII